MAEQNSETVNHNGEENPTVTEDCCQLINCTQRATIESELASNSLDRFGKLDVEDVSEPAEPEPVTEKIDEDEEETVEQPVDAREQLAEQLLDNELHRSEALDESSESPQDEVQRDVKDLIGQFKDSR